MKSKADLILKGLLAVLVTALGWVIVSTIHEHVVVVGDSAPNFRITSDQGRTISPKDFGGKVLVLNFWASWCPPCVEELPMLDRFFREQASNGWQVAGLAIDQPSAVRKFLERTPVSFPNGMAGLQGTDLVKRLGNTSGGLPFTLVLDRGGVVLARKMGKLEPADLDAWRRGQVHG